MDDNKIHKVDTVPPPAGESDAYNAPTRVGALDADTWAELMDAVQRREEADSARAEAACLPRPVAGSSLGTAAGASPPEAPRFPERGADTNLTGADAREVTRQQNAQTVRRLGVGLAFAIVLAIGSWAVFR